MTLAPTHSRARVTLLITSLLAALAGCSGADDASTGTGTGTGGAGGSGGGAPECATGSHLGATGVCEGALAEWTVGPSLLGARDHHATFIAVADAGAFLYVLGGVRDMTTPLKSVESSPIQADGSLGAWTAQTALPEAMIGHSIASAGKNVVVSGGIRIAGSATELSKKTEVTTIQPDGTLGAWASGPELGEGRFHHAMIAHEGSIYVVGGLTGDGKDNTTLVERAVITADGQLGPWEAMTPLPDKRSHHGLVAYGGALWITAGLKGDPANAPTTYKDVLRAPIQGDGTLGQWAAVGELPVPLGTHSSFVWMDYLYVAGGVENNLSNTDHVRRAKLGEDGSLGAWEDAPPLPKKHAHAHQTPVHLGFVYSAGGALQHDSTVDVFIGRFE